MWAILLSLLSRIPSTALSLFTGINFGSIFAGVGTFFKDMAASITKHWPLYLVGTLLLSNVFTAWEWNRTSASLTKEKAAHVADIASFKKAQAEADTKAQAERAVLQKESKANADQADANYTGLLAKYHSSLVRYSQGHPGSTGKSYNYQLPTTQSSNGPSEGTEIPSTITITGDDAEICAENTARLEAVHDWAVTLQEAK